MKIFILILFISIALIFLKYRNVYSQKVIGEFELKYKMIDTGKNDFFKYLFESIFRKKRVYLNGRLENIEWIYLSANDFNNLHPESPLKMRDKKYSIKFKFETNYLVFGGTAFTKIISFEKINYRPEISKS